MLTKHLIIGALTTLSIACNNVDQSQPRSIQMAEAHGIVNFDCNLKHKDSLATSNWDYVSGLVANSLIKAYEVYPEKKNLLRAVKSYADYNTSSTGDSIFKGDTHINAIGESNIDDIAAGKIFFALYDDAITRNDSTDIAKYKTALDMLRNKLKYQHARIPEGMPGSGGFFHKKQYKYQMWLDGLYMGPAFYAQWQHVFGATEGDSANMACWSDIALQFKILHEHTYDTDKQLCYHGWSAAPDSADSFWARSNKHNIGCSPEFWGRGMGWYFGALTDILEWMPKDHPDYPTLVNNYQLVAAGLKRWQDKETGLWYQLLQYDSTTTADAIGDSINGNVYNIGSLHNYLESSASCMYTYAYFKGIRLGLLDEKTYMPVARKAFEGINKQFITLTNGTININSICASAGLGPAKDLSRTGTKNYYLCGKDVRITSNEGKAIGTYILAAVEEEMSRDYTK